MMTGAPGTVLVVDDDASTRASLTNLLRSVGLEVRTFSSAAELLDSPLPDAIGFDTGAAFVLTYGTSWHAIKDRAELQPLAPRVPVPERPGRAAHAA